MSIQETTKSAETSLSRDLIGAARYYIGGRRGLIALGGGAIALAAWYNWGWLAAAGIAPILVGIAPCAVMCALGLCMSKMFGSSGDHKAPPEPPGVNSPEADSSLKLTASSQAEPAGSASPAPAPEGAKPKKSGGCC